MEKSYGLNIDKTVNDSNSIFYEELAIKGYTILNNVLNEEMLIEARLRLNDVYQKQIELISEEELSKINEENLARCPLAYDEYFVKVAANSVVLEFVSKILGDYFILHLQNGIINTPDKVHHQTSWHRDLPYQNFEISTPISIGALFCIDDFTVESGGTYVVPYTHKMEKLPSVEYIDKNKIQVEAKAGSVIIFDSMLLHRAGENVSNFIRRGINNVYTVPIIKQQINLQTALSNKYSNDERLSKLFGYTSNTPETDFIWRKNKINKL